MSKFQVILAKSAGKKLKKLPKKKRLGILKALKELEKDPYLGKPLIGELSGLFSLRIWPYRVIYRIEKSRLMVIILDIGHRQGIYKNHLHQD